MFTFQISAKKPSKNDAYKLIEKLCSNEVLSDLELSQLLLFFQPTVPRVTKDPLRYVSRACSNVINRNTCYIQSENGRLFANNGHLMLTCQSNLLPGWYSQTGHEVRPMYPTDFCQSYNRFLAGGITDPKRCTYDQLAKEKDGKYIFAHIDTHWFRCDYLEKALNGAKSFEYCITGNMLIMLIEDMPIQSAYAFLMAYKR